MPSASVKVEKQAPPETALLDSTGTLTPLRQAITIIEHKIRNLEKRKSKLESYKELQNSGKELNADQKIAVAKYGEVAQTLEFARDLSKQFMGIVIVSEKDAKRLAKKEAAARISSELAKVREVLLVQDALNQMGHDSVRNDFLSGSNGAVTLAQSDLDLLDELYPAVTPKHEAGDGSTFTARVQSAAEHLIAVVDGKQKDAFLGSSYTQIKELIGKVHESGYLDTEIAVTGAPALDDTDGLAPEEQEPELEVATAITAPLGVDEQQSEMVMGNSEPQPIIAESQIEVHHHIAQQQLGGAPSHQAPQQQTPNMLSDHSVTGYHQGSVALPQTQVVVPQQSVPVLSHEINPPPAVLPHHHHHHHQQQPHQQQPQLPPHQQQQNVLPPMQQQIVIDSPQILQQQQGPPANQQPLYYQQPPPARNINEVLGQGSFFFLQDSEIDNPAIAGSSDQLSSVNSHAFTNQPYTPSPHPQPSQPLQQISAQQPLSQQQQVVPPPQTVANNMQTMYNAHPAHQQPPQQPQQQQQALTQHQTTQHHQQPQQALHTGIQRSSVSPVHSNVTKHTYTNNSNNSNNNGAMKNGATNNNNMSNVDDNIMVEKHHRNVGATIGGSGGGGSGHRGPPRINSNHHHQQSQHQSQQQSQPFYANNNGYSNRSNRSSGSSGPSRSSRTQHQNQ